MANTNIRTAKQEITTGANPNGTPNGMIEVLYQKMGDRWFAFSLIDDEVFVGSISQDEIDKISTDKSVDSSKTIIGNA